MSIKIETRRLSKAFYTVLLLLFAGVSIVCAVPVFCCSYDFFQFAENALESMLAGIKFLSLRTRNLWLELSF